MIFFVFVKFFWILGYWYSRNFLLLIILFNNDIYDISSDFEDFEIDYVLDYGIEDECYSS